MVQFRMVIRPLVGGPATRSGCGPTLTRKNSLVRSTMVHFLLRRRLFASMKTIDYRLMAEEWVEHVVQQYEVTHVCRKDLSLIEHLLKAGFTLVAVRDPFNVLHVDFVGKRSLKPKKLAAA